MAHYRSIEMSFWTDQKICDLFSPLEKLVYLYLLTNPATSICGCYEISMRKISFETGIERDDLEAIMNCLIGHDVIRYSKETSEVLIINWIKYHNEGGSGKVKTAIMKGVADVKNPEFKQFLIGYMEGIDTLSIPYQYPIDTLSIPYGKNVNVNVNENVNENVKDTPPTPSKRFTPPSPDEVAAYCGERGNGISGEEFCDFYASKGWMVGKNHMKDWKAAVRTWEKQRGFVMPKKTTVKIRDPNEGLDKYDDDDPEDKLRHPYEDGWRINDDGYWVQTGWQLRQKGNGG